MLSISRTRVFRTVLAPRKKNAFPKFVRFRRPGLILRPVPGPLFKCSRVFLVDASDMVGCISACRVFGRMPVFMYAIMPIVCWGITWSQKRWHHSGKLSCKYDHHGNIKCA